VIVTVAVIFTGADSHDGRQRSDRRHSTSSWVGVYAYYFTLLQLKVDFYWLFWKKLLEIFSF